MRWIINLSFHFKSSFCSSAIFTEFRRKKLLSSSSSVNDRLFNWKSIELLWGFSGSPFSSFFLCHFPFVFCFLKLRKFNFSLKTWVKHNEIVCFYLKIRIGWRTKKCGRIESMYKFHLPPYISASIQRLLWHILLHVGWSAACLIGWMTATIRCAMYDVLSTHGTE